MAHGRPVVASAVGGLLDAVDDGVTGMLVPPGDLEALRAAVVSLLADAPRRRELGANARERAARLFSWEAAIRGTLAVYRDASERTEDA